MAQPCSARRHGDPGRLPTSCRPTDPSQKEGEAESFLLPSPLPDALLVRVTESGTHARRPGWTSLTPGVPELGASEARMLGFWPLLPAGLAQLSLSCCPGLSSSSPPVPPIAGRPEAQAATLLRGPGERVRATWRSPASLCCSCVLWGAALGLSACQRGQGSSCSRRPFPGRGTEGPLYCRCSQGTAWEPDSPATPPMCQQTLALARTHPTREEHPALLTLFPRTPPLPGGPVHLLLMAEPWAFPAASAPCPWGGVQRWGAAGSRVGVRPSWQSLRLTLCTQLSPNASGQGGFKLTPHRWPSDNPPLHHPPPPLGCSG